MMLWSSSCLVHWTVACVTLCYLASSKATTTSLWRPLGYGNVINFEAAEPARSKVDCLKRCDRYSHCSRAAFHPLASTCYLQPLPPIITGLAVLAVMVYQNKDAICAYDEAPVTNATVTWRHKLTSLEGDVVSCDPYFIWNGTDDVTMKCSAENVWTVSGYCRQYYWTFPTPPAVLLSWPIPLPVNVGWKMCLRGIPYANATIFWVNAYNANNDRPLKLSFIMVNEKTIRTESNVNGQWRNQQYVKPSVFPVARSVPFFLEIRLSSMNALQVYVNSTWYCTHTSPIDVAPVRIDVHADVDLLDLNLWCD